VHSKDPATQLPSILANTSTGIVNSKLVRKHGGTAAASADKTDKAEGWFNSSASAGAGSGPYLLKTYSTTSQITLVPNKRYWGKRKAAFKTVVIRNMIAPTQLINIQRGVHEVAIDLSSDQAQTLRSNNRLKVVLQPSTWIFWLFTNNNPQISTITPNKQFQTAVRYALDYKSIVGVAGPGDPGARNDPVDVPRLAEAEGRDQAEPGEGEVGARSVRRRQPAGHTRVPE